MNQGGTQVSETALPALLAGPKFPDREFVRSGFSYAEVYGMAAGLKEYFSRRGTDEKTLCLAAENRGIIAAALLASLAGGPSLLLPYVLSARVLGAIQQVTGFKTAIADKRGPFSPDTEIFCPTPHAAPARLDSAGFTADAVLLQICTGGTTGTPVIWPKTAANIFLEALYLATLLKVDERDCIIATVSPYHIYGLLFSVVLPLVSSAAVVEQTPSFPEEIREAVAENRGTVLVSVPAHYATLRGKRISATSLRLAVSSAGMLAQPDNEDFTRRNGIDLVEIYGSTETGGVASRNRFRQERDFSVFPAVDWKVADHRLCVRSPYISPHVPRDEEGFFSTGDRVVPHGTRTFSLRGRLDNITKVGGKRVNLDEIRHMITCQPGVQDSVVLALPEAGGREHRIAALVQGEGDPDTIRKALAEVLEPYALPRVITVVEQIPITRNGKHDREAIMRLLSPLP